ncbi:MAG: phosphopantetheine adenylyltransferase [Deltaproteobacteria bacterium]|jgi:pantetheine-phosphate adenylyltransferase|nr:MAG: phosphopantetheine adenylyltransferase [Deltaproteobacteria bacterium]
MRKKVAIYPGSFDPFTKGHINIIERGVKVFDEIIVAVAHNVSKKTIFTLEERVEIIREIFRGRPEIKVDYFEGLLVEYARKVGTNIVLRGMRTVSDFEYELQMALSNKTLYPELETVFMVTESMYSHISSSLIKEIVTLGGSVKQMVPEIVEEKLREKLLKR